MTNVASPQQTDAVIQVLDQGRQRGVQREVGEALACDLIALIALCLINLLN